MNSALRGNQKNWRPPPKNTNKKPKKLKKKKKKKKGKRKKEKKSKVESYSKRSNSWGRGKIGRSYLLIDYSLASFP
jgi:hypothetical protein